MNRREFIETTSAIVASFLLYKTTDNWVEVLKTDTVNSNNRLYPRHVIKNAVKNFTTTYGHLGMPNDSIIHLKDISHVVDKLELVDNSLLAHITLLDTPNGKILKNMESISFRTSGIGTCNTANGVMIINDYKLITINALPTNEAAIFGS